MTCDLNWEQPFDNRKTQQEYATVLLVLLVLVPLCLITFIYSRIFWSLKNKKAVTNFCSEQLRRKRAEDMKVFKNICAILVAFACCLLPIYVYGILFYFVWKWKMPRQMDQFGFFAHFALYSNAAISSVMCIFCISTYRQGLSKVFKRLNFCSGKKRMI